MHQKRSPEHKKHQDEKLELLKKKYGDAPGKKSWFSWLGKVHFPNSHPKPGNHSPHVEKNSHPTKEESHTQEHLHHKALKWFSPKHKDHTSDIPRIKDDKPSILHKLKLKEEESPSPQAKKPVWFGLFTKKEPHDTDLRKLFRNQQKERRKALTTAEKKRRLDDYIEKSGFELSRQEISRRIFFICLALVFCSSSIWVYLARDGSLQGLIIQVLIIWTLGFLVAWLVIWIGFRIYLDLLMFQRKLELEEVLPDFLQLASANLRAGMPIDRALWFAVRPRFGILAKEIEDVAKRTIAGEDLNKALLDFAHKYDSQMLLRSIHLLIEGMEAGGDIADLINKIALNIQEMRGMKKEMSANVTTYVIFITFAAIVAAPALFGLSTQLLSIVQGIAAGVGESGAGSGSVGLSINISADTIKMSDYQIFAYTCLTLSSVFSAIIIAVIRKGNVKEGLDYIPIFLIISLVVYFAATKLLAIFMGGMF